jgi:hypothetical protein
MKELSETAQSGGAASSEAAESKGNVLPWDNKTKH